MSPGAPSAPVSYVPTPTAPTTYQSVIPRASYQDAANYLASTTADLNKSLQAQYQQAGTPAESGAWQKGTRSQEAASYAASLPKGDQWIAQNTGGGPDPYALARESATQRYKDSQQEYQQALQQAKTTPGPRFEYSTPSWANRSASEFAIGAPEAPPMTTPAPAQLTAQGQPDKQRYYRGGKGTGTRMAGQA